jgi:DnaJ-class molecular chaperone|tara:strand:+ start:1452 stop:2135 length:684 start_codon:yes stop_codon:yes gene_type:complete
MKTFNNPWFILGLDPNATLKQVKLAYKRLAIKSHPDKGGTIADWLEISQAYETITNKKHVPIVKASDTKMFNIALTIQQQINGLNDYIQVDDEDELFIKVNVPKGSLLGDKFKVSNKGKKYIINVKEKADKVFTRQGNNLIMYKTLDIIDVLKRNPFIILSPLNEYVEVDIPADTQTGSIIVIKEQGLYNRKTKKRGNLRINIQVDIPFIDNNNLDEFITRLKNDRY